MDNQYRIIIFAVDGVTSFSTKGNAQQCLDFLKKYDHEGSGLMLEYNDNHMYSSEVIYKLLSENSK